MNSQLDKNDAYTSSELQENLQILRQTKFFSVMPIENMKVFAYICSREAYKAGDYLFHQDEDDGQAFYIISGKARLVISCEGREEVIREYREGEFLGGMSLFAKMHRHFSLVAETDLKCLTVTREKFMATMGQFPELMPRIVQTLVESVYRWEERFMATRSKCCEACRHWLGVSVI